MALHTKKIYYKRSGVIYPINTYTTAGEAGTAYIALRDGATTVYAPIVVAEHANASHIAVRHAGATKRLGKTAGDSVSWAVRCGGTSLDYTYISSIDTAGNTYIVGYFSGTATFSGLPNLVSSGSYDIFIAKINSSGAWQWATKASSTQAVYGQNVVVNSAGDVYICGTIQGTTSFAGVPSLTSGGYGDIFVAKLNSSGAWQWAKSASGPYADGAVGLAMDSNGDLIVSGNLTGPGTFGSYTATQASSTGGFLAKISSTGTWMWAKPAGPAFSTAYALTLDASNNIYIAGYFQGTATFGNTITSSGQHDMYLAKADSNGVWQWGLRGGGSGQDYSLNIEKDSSNNLYVCGYFSGNATFGSTSLTGQGADDIFIAKATPSGSWEWAVNAGGTSTDYGFSVRMVNGTLKVAGGFSGVGTFGVHTITSAGAMDIFIADLNPVTFIWEGVKRFGGPTGDYATSVVVDSGGSLILSGTFSGSVTFGGTTLTSAGGDDVFVVKL
jgi:hypothetical protein